MNKKQKYLCLQLASERRSPKRISKKAKQLNLGLQLASERRSPKRD